MAYAICGCRSERNRKMRNFDEMYTEDRSFVIGGETFHWEPVFWRVYSEWVDTAVEEQNRLQKETPEGQTPNLKLIDTFEDIIKRVLLFIVPEEKDAFEALVTDPEKKITTLQLSELSTWLLEVQTERPTTPPSPSGNGATSPVVTSVAG
jgi:hypothetical protein